MTYYHASANDLGPTFTFTRGGYYEATDDYGAAKLRYTGAGFGDAGFEQSDVPELAASKSIAGAVFAQTLNLANDAPPVPELGTYPITVYEIGSEPDVDMTNTVSGDFALIEEVRYREPSESPVEGEYVETYQVPWRAAGDVQLTYLPGNSSPITEWGEAVKQELAHFIDTGEYRYDRLSYLRPDPDDWR